MTNDQLIERLSISPVFGCLTRNALDIQLEILDLTDKSIVFFDIDSLKAANVAWGKELVNFKITQSLRAHRFSDLVVGQWFSGDEFVAIVPTGDSVGFAERILKALQFRQMSATFIIAECDPTINVHQLVERCDKRADHEKGAGNKGQIFLL